MQDLALGLVCIAVVAVVVALFVHRGVHPSAKTFSTVPIARLAYSPKLDTAERACLFELVGHVQRLFDRRNIRWMPTAGNLLAIYRHQDWLIPWDDDYDISVHKDQHAEALDALETGLPSEVQTTLVSHWTAGAGKLYKVSFKADHPDHCHLLRRHSGYTWPFVDVFMEGTDTTALGCGDIQDHELPLQPVVVHGLKVYVPSAGQRSLEAFQARRDLMHICTDSTYIHKYENGLRIVGNRSRPCSEVCPRVSDRQ